MDDRPEPWSVLGTTAPRQGIRPARGAVALWRLDTRQDVIGGHRVGGALLDTAERSRAAALVRPGDRHRYLAAHVGLRVLLGGYLGIPPELVSFVREDCPHCGGPHGRPALGGDPPAGLHFSLTHSGAVAAVAVATAPVGLDIEAHPRPELAGGLLRFLHPRESAALLALSAAARPAALARVWVRKEACLKATGAGIGYGLTHPFVGASPVPAPVPGWTSSDLCPPLDTAQPSRHPPQGLHTRSADETEGAAA
ncbi:4'-phosphopantetheinyl transferase family protein [Streptomyces sp. NBC_01294]|uniref:4'-phosphopantetheinyl transferase family protein n=1 Tax=Streptomyces sp. NBC_01294 TaxID=2903815 RepID=UPI002DDACA3B|nr:4'-phosphopantetheinyl transferase superfamily protein [Streptomyces sp. NBC_01294]WRZ56559.1 4'-phosphopantetheinyl transferase superfamily protein [Streptomyces sp. NBC_01294]